MGQPLDANMVPVLPVHLPSERDFAFWESLRGGRLVEAGAARGEETYSDDQKPARRERGGRKLLFSAHIKFLLSSVWSRYFRWVRTSWLPSTFPCSATTTSINWKKFTKKILKCLVILGLSNKCDRELLYVEINIQMMPFILALKCIKWQIWST